MKKKNCVHRTTNLSFGTQRIHIWNYKFTKIKSSNILQFYDRKAIENIRLFTYVEGFKLTCTRLIHHHYDAKDIPLHFN